MGGNTGLGACLNAFFGCGLFANLVLRAFAGGPCLIVDRSSLFVFEASDSWVCLCDHGVAFFHMGGHRFQKWRVARLGVLGVLRALCSHPSTQVVNAAFRCRLQGAPWWSHFISVVFAMRVLEWAAFPVYQGLCVTLYKAWARD